MHVFVPPSPPLPPPLVEAAIVEVNRHLEGSDADQTLEALQSEYLELKDVFLENKEYYHQGLGERKAEKSQVRHLWLHST